MPVMLALAPRCDNQNRLWTLPDCPWVRITHLVYSMWQKIADKTPLFPGF